MPHGLIDDRAALSALREPVRLRTLTTLRWLAVTGQLAAITLVHFALGFPTPLGLCLGAIAVSAWLNLFTMLRFSPQRILGEREAAGMIAFDIAQLCLLLGFTGGLLNPFAVLILAPVTIAASVLSLRLTILLGALAFAGVSIISLIHLPLPWRPGEELSLAPIYKAGLWGALSFSILFFAAYAYRIASESAKMRSALTATQLVLEREQRLNALGGLAAAAAHELGTPLATIQLTAKELMNEAGEDSLLREDAALLVSQAKRCREILGRLSERGEAGDLMHDRLEIEALLSESADPFLEGKGGPAIRIETHSEDGTPEPVLSRRPEVIYGLRNFIENAVSFATTEVLIDASWSANALTIAVNDDGRGFLPDILSRLGEPYVSSRSGARPPAGRKYGMGLGFFIAKTLLEGSGAAIDYQNRQWGRKPSQNGASVIIAWPAKAIFTDPTA